MLSRIHQFDPKRIYNSYKDEIDKAVQDVLSQGSYIGGEFVKSFEEELASYLSEDNEYTVISCANGTDALELAFRAANLKPGDEILMPSHNYVSAVEMAVNMGLVPIWVDTAPDAFTIEYRASELVRYLSSKTKALVAVNMYGMSAQWQELRNFCTQYGLILIEDNAQGLGGQLRVDNQLRKLGTFGDISTMSFFPTKPLGCMGDGGAICCRKDSPYADRLRRLHIHGQEIKYQFVEPGRNSRLDALQAAILRVKLRHLSETLGEQARVAKSYSDALAIVDSRCLTLPTNGIDLSKSYPSWHLYTIRVKRDLRDKLRAFLSDQKIDAGVYYPVPMHQVECYSSISSSHSCVCKRSDELSEEILSLPCYAFMEEEEVARVVAAVIEFFYN